MKKTHLLLGAIGFLAFIATGIYMKASFPAAYNGNEVAHMMFRANHIYLLLSAFLNLVLGLFLISPKQALARKVQNTGSLLLLFSTIVFFAAFFIETAQGNFERPLSLIAVVATVVGIGLLCFSSWRETKANAI